MSSADRPAVLVAAQYLRPGNGGIGEVARLTTKSLAGDARVAALACLEPSDFSFEQTDVKAFQGNRARFVFSLAREALKARRVVYDFAGTARAARFVWPRRPYMVWAHGIEVWGDDALRRAQPLRGADLVLVNSEHTLVRADRALKGLRDIRICRLGTYSDDPPAAWGPSQGPPTVLLLGRTDPDFPKGQAILIALWPRVVDAVPDARLLLVGRGPSLPALRDLAARSAAAASIEVAGFVPEESIEDVWRRASVFAMPSRAEGFGLVFIEAMRRGLPVIASREDAGREVNLDGETGYNLARDRPQAILEAIVALLRDPGLAARLGAAAQQRWRDAFRFSAFDARLRAATADFLKG